MESCCGLIPQNSPRSNLLATVLSLPSNVQVSEEALVVHREVPCRHQFRPLQKSQQPVLVLVMVIKASRQDYPDCMLVASHEHIHLGAKILADLVVVVVETAVAAAGEHRTVAATVASLELDGAEKC